MSITFTPCKPLTARQMHRLTLHSAPGETLSMQVEIRAPHDGCEL